MRNKSLPLRLTARLRKNTLFSGCLSYFGSNLPDKSWVFVVGCYNSGTTLLAQILGSHSRISDMNEEGVMLTNKLPRPEDFLWRRMWAKCEEQMIHHAPTTASEAQIIKRHWSHFYDRSKDFLVEKSISNTLRLLFLQEYFQPAYFIHIVRNGYAVAEGIQRKAEIMPGNGLYDQRRYPLAMCAQQWARNMEIIERDRPLIKNFLEISYEDLTGQPDRTLKKICGFLGIEPFPDSLITSSFSVHRREDVIRNMNDKSLSSLSANEVDAINQIASKYLHKYGYYQSR